MVKNTLWANALVLLAILFVAVAFLSTPLWGIILSVLLPFVMYWRVKLFPNSGFMLIRFVAIWVGMLTLGGLLLGFLVAAICGEVFHMQMHHGFGALVLFVGVILGLVAGIVVGIRKFRCAVISLPPI